MTITEDKVVYLWDMTRPEKRGHKDKFNIGHNVWSVNSTIKKFFNLKIYITSNTALVVYPFSTQTLEGVLDFNTIPARGGLLISTFLHSLLHIGLKYCRYNVKHKNQSINQRITYSGIEICQCECAFFSLKCHFFQSNA